MTPHVDILDSPEPLGRSFAAAVVLHLAVAAGVLGFNLMGHHLVEKWGDPGGGGLGAVSVSPVSQIPLPSRGGPVNPVANDTESKVPEPPAKTKPQPRVTEPDADAIAIKSRNAKKRASQAASSPNKFREQQKDLPNQTYSSTGQTMSSPLVGLQGSGGIGIGNNSPFGYRFGSYAEVLRRRVAEKWNTTDIDPRIRTAPQVIVQFTIRRDGTVPSNSVRIVQRSNVYALDVSAQRAIYDASPMPPLPPGFERNEAVIEFVFELRR